MQLPSPWSLVASADLNADGHPDLIWESTDGTRAVTYMTGGQYAGSYTLMFVIPAAWHIVGAADFDGDTKPDLVVNNLTTGASAVVYLNGAAWTGVNGDLPTFTSWRMAAVGDMNNDTKPDLIWRDTTGTITAPIVSTMNGLSATATQSVTTSPPSSSWRVGAVADFDGDGKGDFLMQNISDGSRIIWHMNVTSRLGYSFLPTVANTYKVIAAKLFQWPIVDSYVVNTGQPPSNNIGWSIFGLNPGTCSPQPSCLSNFAQLGAKFTIGSQEYIDHIDAWVFAVGGPMNVNIRADSAGKPGAVVYSKGYPVGSYGFDLWVPFSQYGVVLPAGSYWVTFEAIDYGGASLGMPNPAPTPQATEAFRSNSSGGWATTTLGLGIRIKGHVSP